MNSPFFNASTFLIETLFDLYILTFVLRFLLQIVKANYYNPVCQFLIKVTDPVLLPLRRIMPSWKSIDWTCVAALLLLELVKFALISFAIFHIAPNILGLLLQSIASILQITLNVFFFAIIIEVILSWVNPTLNNPATAVIYQLSNLLLNPVRRIVPLVGGLDLSPLVVLILLKFIEIAFISQLSVSAAQLTYHLYGLR